MKPAKISEASPMVAISGPGASAAGLAASRILNGTRWAMSPAMNATSRERAV